MAKTIIFLKRLHILFFRLPNSIFWQLECKLTYQVLYFISFLMYNRKYFYDVLIPGITNLITFQIRTVTFISRWQEKLIKWEMHCWRETSVHSTLPHIHGQLTEKSSSACNPSRTLCCCLHFLFCKEIRTCSTRNMIKATLLPCKLLQSKQFHDNQIKKSSGSCS